MAGKLDALAIMLKTSIIDVAEICPFPIHAAETSNAISDGKRTIETESKNGLGRAKRGEALKRDVEAMDDAVDVMAAASMRGLIEHKTVLAWGVPIICALPHRPESSSGSVLF